MPPTPIRFRPHGPRGWLPLALGLLALAGAGYALKGADERPAKAITITPGPEHTTRTLYTRILAQEIEARGVATRIVPARTTLEIFRRVDAGQVDFALVAGALNTAQFSHVREVAPLYSEALHLLVKRELADQVAHSLNALRGHTVNLGAPGSATAELSAAILAMAEVPRVERAGQDGYIPRQAMPEEELPANPELGDGLALPDAVFHIATVPSTIATRYVQLAGYRLVPVPFADAFRLSAIFSSRLGLGAEGEVERNYVSDTVIPPFTYQVEPAVPPEPTHTLGVPLLLIAHESVGEGTVAAVMEAVFDSRFARMHEPALDRSVLSLPPRLPLHPGSVAFRQREKPFFTADDVGVLSNWLSVAGALVGAALFLWQAWRQRRAAARQELLSGYLSRVAEIERRTVEMELSSALELDRLIELQQELLRVKSGALDDFAAGNFQGQAVLFDLLGPINAAWEHLGRLLLHVRENIETLAVEEGKTAEEVWEEVSDQGV